MKCVVVLCVIFMLFVAGVIVYWRILNQSLIALYFQDVGRSITKQAGILWSRNWYKLVDVECRLPDSYYAASTSVGHNSTYLVSYLKECSGVLWLRVNDIGVFFSAVLPLMTRPFTLITSDGDWPVPSCLPEAEIHLRNPLLLAWYTQNYDGTSKHLKLKPIPIGFDLHSQFDSSHKTEIAGWTEMKRIRYHNLLGGGRFRNMAVFIDGMNQNTNSERSSAITSISSCTSNTVIQTQRIPRFTLYLNYSSYAFGLSPHGGGLDTHRTWEMLFFGMVPIVIASSLDVLYKDLPVLIVKNYSSVCGINLDTKYQEFERLFPVSEEVFSCKYWLK